MLANDGLHQWAKARKAATDVGMIQRERLAKIDSDLHVRLPMLCVFGAV